MHGGGHARHPAAGLPVRARGRLAAGPGRCRPGPPPGPRNLGRVDDCVRSPPLRTRGGVGCVGGVGCIPPRDRQRHAPHVYALDARPAPPEGHPRPSCGHVPSPGSGPRLSPLSAHGGGIPLCAHTPLVTVCLSCEFAAPLRGTASQSPRGPLCSPPPPVKGGGSGVPAAPRRRPAVACAHAAFSHGNRRQQP